MDPKLLLVKVITLLFKESQLKDTTVQSSDLVRSAIATIKLPEGTGEFDRGRDVLQSLRATALWMADNPPDYEYDRASLLQRIRVNVGDEDGIYHACEGGLELVDDHELLKKQVLLMRGELRNQIDSVQVKELVKKMYQKAYFNLDGFDVRQLTREIREQLEPYSTLAEGHVIEGMLSELDIANEEDAANFVLQAQTETTKEGILKLGWQAMNRMLGDHDGLRRGECVVVGALQHNFKTGFTLAMFKQLALYNKPFMRDPTKKPLLLHWSTENDLHINILWLYRNLIENETGEACNLSTIDPREAAAYVNKRLTANGYHIRMIRTNPADTTYQSYVDYITQLEAEGYEVHAVVCDYLNMFSKRGLAQGPAGFEVRDLWRRMRNFNGPRGTTFISPHQLSPDAKRLARQNVEDLVKEIANKGYYDGSTTIDQEVDLEIYIHIVKINGKSYLTVQRGKHRKVTPTAERHLYTVLPFDPVGDIPDDIDGQDRSVKHVGGMAGDDDMPWFKT